MEEILASGVWIVGQTHLFGKVERCPAVPILAGRQVTASYEKLHHRPGPLCFDRRHVKRCGTRKSNGTRPDTNSPYSLILCNDYALNLRDMIGLTPADLPVLKLTSSRSVSTGPNSSSIFW